HGSHIWRVRQLLEAFKRVDKMPVRFRNSHAFESIPPRGKPVIARLRVASSTSKMACVDLGLMLHVELEVGQECASNRIMMTLPRGTQQRLVRGCLHQNMFEHIRLRAALRCLPSETGIDYASEVIPKCLLATLAYGTEKRIRKLATDGRCQL